MLMKCVACVGAKFLVVHKPVRGGTEGTVKGAAGGGAAKDGEEKSFSQHGSKENWTCHWSGRRRAVSRIKAWEQSCEGS